MSTWLSRVPWKESKGFILVCSGVFLALLMASLVVERPVKQERNIEKRREEGKIISPESYVPVWLYKGLQMNLVLAGALLAASPWLGRRRRESLGLFALPEGTARRWWLLAGAGLMGLAAWHHAPRLHHSMWGDEEFNASRFILSSMERQEDGTLVEKPRRWVTTLWSMRKPTNHLGYSFFARLSHDTFFRPGTGADDPWFSEALLRAPVFIAGLLLIPAFLWALHVWGLSPWWGLLLMMLHPWYLRFGVDGRGYGFLMLAAAVLAGVAGRALQTGRWRWWALAGLGGFVVVWSNLQGVYLLVALHLVFFMALWRRDLTWEARRWLASRWIVSGVLTGMLILGYLTPCWPQLLEFMAKGEIAGTMDGRFWQDAFGAWFFGQSWVPWGQPENPLRFAMQLSMNTLPWLHWLGIGAVVLLVLLGVWVLLADKARRPLLGLALGAPAVMLLHMTVSGTRPYDWYFSPFVPGLFLLVAAGATWAGKRCPPWVCGTALAVVIGLYAFITREPRQRLRNHAIEACRESVASYRTIMTPRHPDIEKHVISGAYTMFTEGYDPAMHRFHDVAGLESLMQKAEQSGRQLYINVGHVNFLQHAPGTRDVTAILLDPTRFENTGTFHGLLPYTTRDVFRYVGRSGATR